MRARRSAVVLLVTGATCLAGAAFPLLSASADGEPGSGFGRFNLAANAPVLQFRVDAPGSNCAATPAGTAACEGVLNESVSTLRNGPIGHALSSFAWPGSLAGNLGSLLIVAGNAPSQVTVLNDPVKAENFSSGQQDTVTNSQVPGVTMSATATATKVAATSTIVDTSKVSALGSLGQITSSSSTVLTGASSALSTAHSAVQDITLGPLHIGAVVSDAKATTDGKVATASGTTTVVGATVAGVPVTIDSNGVHVQGQGGGSPSQATDAVNTALKQAGMTLSLSTPIGTPMGAQALFNAGALNLVWAPQAGTTISLALGGAQVMVDGSPGFSFGYLPVTNIAPFTGGTTGGTTGAVAPAPNGGVLPNTSGSLPAGDSGAGTVPPPAVSGTTPISSSPVSAIAGLPHGVSPWAGILALVGAALVMVGLRRLPDRVLVTPATACPQGELA